MAALLLVKRPLALVARVAASPRLSRRSLLVPAPSVEWDPSRARAVPVDPSAGPSAAEATIGLTIRLPEDAVLQARGAVGDTLLNVLAAADLSDVWPGGACGGACQCSTCRVVVERAPLPLPPRGEEEEDMLDTAASAAARQPDADADAADAYLAPESRLACQLVLRAGDDGLEVTLPDDVLNILEVPLWLRGSR
jgi:ferredoxin